MLRPEMNVVLHIRNKILSDYIRSHVYGRLYTIIQSVKVDFAFLSVTMYLGVLR
jgi:hypothetical protein